MKRKREKEPLIWDYDIQQTDPENGLNNEQVLAHRQKYGANVIEKKKKTNIFIKFLKQFLDPMVLLLAIAGIITLVLAIVRPADDTIELITSYVEFGVICFILLLNASFGVYQETKAEKESEALSKLTSPHARVIRNGETIQISAQDVVVGDLLVVEAGDNVAADAILLRSSSLEVDEAVLTGESLPAKKDDDAIIAADAGIGDQKNKIFASTNVINGTAKAVVVQTGMQTEIGTIANLINKQKDEKTPLQQKINKLSKIIGGFASVLCIVVLIMYVYLVGGGDWKTNWASAVILAISLSFAAIPEGLVAIVTIILSFGVKQMSKKNALIKQLSAVETLGSANVICSDKTGTLTQNKMTITHFYTHETGLQTYNANKKAFDLMQKAVVVNNATVNDEDLNNIVYLGDPTEIAILQAYEKYGLDENILDQQFERIFEYPFDSDRKMMSVVVKHNNQFYLVTKGAIEMVSQRTKTRMDDELWVANAKMANQALRVLAVCFTPLKEWNEEQDHLTVEQNLECIGLIGMIDPPRPEAIHAIDIAKEAGIRPIMITGDHIQTASAIARQMHILEGDQKTISGLELQAMDDETLSATINDYSVYARVSPSDKIRIVNAWKKHDKVVAMTGDGVNDAPALKAADIGCAMGIMGTEVSKQAANMILIDDNFKTIVRAVKMGRLIMDAIKRVIILLLITNLSGLISLFFGLIILNMSPMSSLQVLWINIVSETLPGIALGLNFTNINLMKNQPLSKSAPILTWRMWLQIIFTGLFIGFSSILLFYLGVGGALNNFDLMHMRYLFANFNLWEHNFEHTTSFIVPSTYTFPEILHAVWSGSSLSFMFMGLMLSFNAAILKVNHSIFIDSFKELKYVFMTISISFAMMFILVYVPKINSVFSVHPLYTGEYTWFNVLPFLFVFVVFMVSEIIKFIKYRRLLKTYVDYKCTYKQLKNSLKKLKSTPVAQYSLKQQACVQALIVNTKLRIKYLKKQVYLHQQ
ncbi:cation-translocating P-type ATPase [Ureaplasma miroungigenitalium]|uniref:Cation-translocating P-type ATPase n=1 Tax=Ureaplasma miroungigenitalium TaxID=1042321 RepID=A0ABT3BMF7_9BACT|nr:cation-translocating P-type ATPase [Ureaplasma miroungigenitalium]MCV3728271.1 cation-translocating P-type ATPase [Ureaplasma miroungigenitalium]